MNAQPWSEGLPPVAILAGGLGTRMHPATESLPKAMLPVAGEPFLGHQLRGLARRGITDAVLCCGHLSEPIVRYAGNGSDFGLRVRYSHDGPAPLGTGGALRKSLPLLGEEFFVLYGDSYLEADFSAIYRAFLQSRLPALMTIFNNRGRWDVSNVKLHDGLVAQYGHGVSADMEYIDYGLSLFTADPFRAWPAEATFPLTEIQRMLAANRQMAAFEVTERFYEIGSPRGLAETDLYLRTYPHGRREVAP
ncbi:nucleotidyltransferase family protein [Silvibacterium sp.]|uniref:nucleotidyltransferase family protein n=1 Tax=Silvibacterium sp. TaxID=1964179 RepID=UPI0039E48947